MKHIFMHRALINIQIITHWNHQIFKEYPRVYTRYSYAVSSPVGVCIKRRRRNKILSEEHLKPYNSAFSKNHAATHVRSHEARVFFSLFFSRFAKAHRNDLGEKGRGEGRYSIAYRSNIAKMRWNVMWWSLVIIEILEDTQRALLNI